jgi:MoaA/NifB/PqqE/SkfB family radical SAM enzyme
MPEYKPEMTIEEWKKAISDLKAFLGKFHIQFSGGEPYIKKGFLDLIEYCRSEQVSWGVVTNGSAFLSEKVVRATIAAKPFTINISIDSKRPEIHDYSRGIEGSLDRVVAGIGKLARARKEAGLSFPIVIKPVVHRLNFRFLPEMVSWIQEIGATVVNFQPVDRWTPETYNELWIDDSKDLEDLGRVRDELLAMKRAGAPILNSEQILLAWSSTSGKRRPVRIICPAGSACATTSSGPTEMWSCAGFTEPSGMSGGIRRGKSGTARRPGMCVRKQSSATPCVCSHASRTKRLATN